MNGKVRARKGFGVRARVHGIGGAAGVRTELARNRRDEWWRHQRGNRVEPGATPPPASATHCCAAGSVWRPKGRHCPPGPRPTPWFPHRGAADRVAHRGHGVRGGTPGPFPGRSERVLAQRSLPGCGSPTSNHQPAAVPSPARRLQLVGQRTGETVGEHERQRSVVPELIDRAGVEAQPRLGADAAEVGDDGACVAQRVGGLDPQRRRRRRRRTASWGSVCSLRARQVDASRRRATSSGPACSSGGGRRSSPCTRPRAA